MQMKQPCHPGLLVRDVCLEATGLTVTDAADVLGVSRGALSRVLNGKAGVSPEMALRFAKAFGGAAEVWLRMQAAYDLSQVEKTGHAIHVKRQYAVDAKHLQ